MEKEPAKRKNKGPNFGVYVGASFPHATFSEIEQVAKDLNLRKAEVLRALCLRGLDAYHDDGQLTGQTRRADQSPAQPANDQSAEAA